MLAFSGGTEGIAAWPRNLFYLWLGPIVSLAVSACLWIGVPVWIQENTGIRKLPARTMLLAKRAYWRIVTSWCMTALISWVLTVSASFVVFAAYRILMASTHSSDLSKAMMLIPGFTASIFASPLLPIALTLIYYDQRIRQEGFDIETMMDRAGMNAAVVVVPPVSAAGANEGEQPA
jgi:hypothetical protein